MQTGIKNREKSVVDEHQLYKIWKDNNYAAEMDYELMKKLLTQCNLLSPWENMKGKQNYIIPSLVKNNQFIFPSNHTGNPTTSSIFQSESEYPPVPSPKQILSPVLPPTSNPTEIAKRAKEKEAKNRQYELVGSFEDELHLDDEDLLPHHETDELVESQDDNQLKPADSSEKKKVYSHFRVYGFPFKTPLPSIFSGLLINLKKNLPGEYSCWYNGIIIKLSQKAEIRISIETPIKELELEMGIQVFIKSLSDEFHVSENELHPQPERKEELPEDRVEADPAKVLLNQTLSTIHWELIKYIHFTFNHSLLRLILSNTWIYHSNLWIKRTDILDSFTESPYLENWLFYNIYGSFDDLLPELYSLPSPCTFLPPFRPFLLSFPSSFPLPPSPSTLTLFSSFSLYFLPLHFPSPSPFPFYLNFIRFLPSPSPLPLLPELYSLPPISNFFFLFLSSLLSPFT